MGTPRSSVRDTACVDPRVARSKAAVLEAAVELLAEHGYGGASVDRISERSGVAKTTIYRHWPCRADLLLDAFDSLVHKPEPVDTGSLRRDLVEQLTFLADQLRSAKWARILPSLIDAAERDPHLAALARDFAVQRREPLRAILARARQRGELGPEVDLDRAATLLAAPLFFRRLVSREPVTRALVADVVDSALAMFAGVGAHQY